MYHLVLLLVCILSLETLARLKVFSKLNLILAVTTKAYRLIFSDKISDHWKETVLPVYASKIIKGCLLILLGLFFIGVYFFAASYFFEGFFNFTFSLSGIFEAIIVAFGHLHFRKLFVE